MQLGLRYHRLPGSQSGECALEEKPQSGIIVDDQDVHDFGGVL
jgi:hypothetical protein